MGDGLHAAAAVVGFQAEEGLTHVGEGLEGCDGRLAADEGGAEHGAGESGGHLGVLVLGVKV